MLVAGVSEPVLVSVEQWFGVRWRLTRRHVFFRALFHSLEASRRKKDQPPVEGVQSCKA